MNLHETKGGLSVEKHVMDDGQMVDAWLGRREIPLSSRGLDFFSLPPPSSHQPDPLEALLTRDLAPVRIDRHRSLHGASLSAALKTRIRTDFSSEGLRLCRAHVLVVA